MLNLLLTRLNCHILITVSIICVLNEPKYIKQFPIDVCRVTEANIIHIEDLHSEEVFFV